MENYLEFGYWGLFIASFLAATIIPLSSEGILVGMLLGGFDPVLCLALATFGNWAGGLSSYFLGYLGRWQWLEKYLRVKREKVFQWKSRADKYGEWLALLCWAPIIGDLIAIALGVFRVRVARVAILMLAGKFARYAVVVWLTLAGGEWAS